MQQRDIILADEADCKQKLALSTTTSFLLLNSKVSRVVLKSRMAQSDIHMIFVIMYRMRTGNAIFQHNLL